MVRMTTRLIISAAKRRGWSVEIISEEPNIIKYTDTRGKEYLLNSVLTDGASAVHKVITDNKQVLYKLAQQWDVPIPETWQYVDREAAEEFLRRQKRVVVKPANAGHGRGITTDITRVSKLHTAIKEAHEFSSTVLLQKHLVGDDYRLLFIGGSLRAAAIRKPAEVIGDGHHTARELIDIENNNPERGQDYEKKLNIIDVHAAQKYLGSNINKVVPKGEAEQAVGVANIGTGGKATDVTGHVPRRMLEYATKLARQIHLPVCGIDFIDDEVSGPTLIEMNACPSFGLHAFPSQGTPRPVAEDFLNWLESTN